MRHHLVIIGGNPPWGGVQRTSFWRLPLLKAKFIFSAVKIQIVAVLLFILWAMSYWNPEQFEAKKREHRIARQKHLNSFWNNWIFWGWTVIISQIVCIGKALALNIVDSHGLALQILSLFLSLYLVDLAGAFQHIVIFSNKTDFF